MPGPPAITLLDVLVAEAASVGWGTCFTVDGSRSPTLVFMEVGPHVVTGLTTNDALGKMIGRLRRVAGMDIAACYRARLDRRQGERRLIEAGMGGVPGLDRREGDDRRHVRPRVQPLHREEG